MTTDRSPDRALADHGVGMTDLVKRATPRADELTADEYRAGLARVERLVAWLRPRRGVLRRAGRLARRGRPAGRRRACNPRDLGGVPVYVMPSTSGLNARVPSPSSPTTCGRPARLADAST